MRRERVYETEGRRVIMLLTLFIYACFALPVS